MSASSEVICRRAQVESLGYSALASMLVILFIPTIGLWRWLSAEFGATGAFLMPVAAAASVLIVALLFQLRSAGARNSRWRYLLAAAAIATIALYLTDPKFPAKRIHVAEYMLVAFVIRRAACRWLEGTHLIVMTAAISVLFGVHDELIQGLHPERTYGLRDISVDGLGAVSGALAGHGLRLFDGIPKRAKRWRLPSPWQTATLIIGTMFALTPLQALRDSQIPWWTITPLLAAGVVWHLGDDQPRNLGDPAAVAAWLIFTVAVYPVLTHVTPLSFR